VRRRSRQRAEISFDDRERRELEVSEDEIDVPSFLREQ
jgi:hypothetical protein